VRLINVLTYLLTYLLISALFRYWNSLAIYEAPLPFLYLFAPKSVFSADQNVVIRTYVLKQRGRHNAKAVMDETGVS